MCLGMNGKRYKAKSVARGFTSRVACFSLCWDVDDSWNHVVKHFSLLFTRPSGKCSRFVRFSLEFGAAKQFGFRILPVLVLRLTFRPICCDGIIAIKF